MNSPSLRLRAGAAYLAVAMLLASACQARDVPYVPTPQGVVQEMLRTAGVGPGDIVYDLGSGDGRIVISAVRDFGAERATGFEISPAQIRDSRRNAEAAGVADRTRFFQQDIFKADFSEATVLTMYLLPSVNLRLRPRILSELRPGTRVVSHDFSMGDWEPDETVELGQRRVHLWVVPARVAGTWRLKSNREEFRLELTQRYQSVAGMIRAGSAIAPAPVESAALNGNRVHFEARMQRGGRTVPIRLDGRIERDRLAGIVTIDGQSSDVEGIRFD